MRLFLTEQVYQGMCWAVLWTGYSAIEELYIASVQAVESNNWQSNW